jgi:hypothetical protein
LIAAIAVIDRDARGERAHMRAERSAADGGSGGGGAPGGGHAGPRG